MSRASASIDRPQIVTQFHVIHGDIQQFAVVGIVPEDVLVVARALSAASCGGLLGLGSHVCVGAGSGDRYGRGPRGLAVVVVEVRPALE